MYSSSNQVSKMNSEKTVPSSSSSYIYSTAQPTNSFINPFSSNETSQLVVLETKPTSTENIKDNACGTTCLECLQCCAATMEFLACCCVCIQCLAHISR